MAILTCARCHKTEQTLTREAFDQLCQAAKDARLDIRTTPLTGFYYAPARDLCKDCRRAVTAFYSTALPVEGAK